jgi:hypothetical protein
MTTKPKTAEEFKVRIDEPNAVSVRLSHRCWRCGTLEAGISDVLEMWDHLDDHLKKFYLEAVLRR